MSTRDVPGEAESAAGFSRATSSAKRVIYDFGANNGDDLPYYLKKADLVVAVEANPSLCRTIEQRFSSAIAEGRLKVENCVLTGDESNAEVPFYLHKRHHVLGQFPQPDANVLPDYEQVLLPSRSVLSIIHQYGAPHYIKIDIEHYEEPILRAMFQAGIRPPYLSAESHSIKVFALLAGLGDYSAFKLVDGATVAEKYSNHAITVGSGSERYSFPPHSAGPFGDDIPGAWRNADDLFELLAKVGLGWKDIHATNLVQPDVTSRAEKKRGMRRHLRAWVLAKLRRIEHRTG